MFSPAARQRRYCRLDRIPIPLYLRLQLSLPAGNSLLPENPVVLNVFWRVSFGRDYATTTDRAEMMRNSPSGIMYYVPAEPNDPTGRSNAACVSPV